MSLFKVPGLEKHVDNNWLTLDSDAVGLQGKGSAKAKGPLVPRCSIPVGGEATDKSSLPKPQQQWFTYNLLDGIIFKVWAEYYAVILWNLKIARPLYTGYNQWRPRWPPTSRVRARIQWTGGRSLPQTSDCHADLASHRDYLSLQAFINNDYTIEWLNTLWPTRDEKTSEFDSLWEIGPH